MTVQSKQVNVHMSQSVKEKEKFSAKKNSSKITMTINYGRLPEKA